MSTSTARRRMPAGGWVGAIIVAAVAAVALLSAVWLPFDPNHAEPAARLAGPGAEHLLGTDRFGRDVASRLAAGARVSLAVAAGATAISAALGIPAGLIAAQAGGAARRVVLGVADLVVAVPALLMAIVAAAIAGPSTTTSLVAIGVAGAPSFARVALAGARAILSQDFVAAARLSRPGRLSGLRVALVHVLPGIAGLMAVQASITAALAILAEAGLSFLGLGTPPPLASWGRMLNDAQDHLATAPHLAAAPGLAIALTVLGLALLGDGLRDAAGGPAAGRGRR
ncbi:ABC transporter permease [Corynebacterium otitidis]|uniref:ABC transmembrane type-1 domain-containing protein n=2 Tax=Corynebacterium otitidis TaxID=29321 RepID=K0Z5C6_9CORY|nr:ABC transporter permease [Corynebacterium otitidis]EJZ82590.1 hypothetical protein HMPREF9719_00471 [Corynebacterium otitidis ATCC 51513]